MSSTLQRAISAIEPELPRLGDAVNTRMGERDEQYWIEGDRDELLLRAGLMTKRSDQHVADVDDEIVRLRAENTDLRAKLADASDENERFRAEIGRLKSALRAATRVAAGETNPRDDDVLATAE